MQIEIVEPTKTDLEKIQERNEASLPQQVLEGGDPGEISQISVKQVLELNYDQSEYDEEVAILARWAREQVGDDPTQIKWAVRDLKLRVGTPTFGDPIKHLSRFAYLDLQEKQIKREKQQFI